MHPPRSFQVTHLLHSGPEPGPHLRLQGRAQPSPPSPEKHTSQDPRDQPLPTSPASCLTTTSPPSPPRSTLCPHCLQHPPHHPSLPAPPSQHAGPCRADFNPQTPVGARLSPSPRLPLAQPAPLCPEPSPSPSPVGSRQHLSRWTGLVHLLL